MNAERLNAIAKAIRSDMKATRTVAHLSELSDALANQVNQPQQPSYQQQVSETLKLLHESLTGAASNDFSPAWKQCSKEIGASELIGERLLTRIKEVFERNQITPSVAHEEIQSIHKEATELAQALTQLSESLDILNIGSEELNPGECEIGFLIPRDSVKNKLEAFSSELHLLNKTFGTFSELSTGSRPGFGIRTISSSDLTVFLDIVPEVCACSAIAIERIVSLYKQLLEIRELRARLSEQGVSNQSLKGVDSHANAHMKDGIDELIGELIERYASNHDEGRKNELRTELKHALNRIANRVDKGFNFEIRVEPPEEPEEGEEEGGEDTPESSAIQIALDSAGKLQFLKPGGKEILSLPEPEQEEGEE